MTKPIFVAEVSSNHHQDINRCKAFIRASSDIGCDAVKFQLFKIDELFAPEILSKSKKHQQRKQWELPETFIPELSSYTHELGLQFSCTPFYLGAVDVLEAHVDFYKIASYELLWDDLIIACAKTGKDVVLSTGMATLPEIAHAVDVFKLHGQGELILLHAISGYPTPVDQANLAAIDTLKKAFGVAVGLSDHSVSAAVVARACHHWGATMVEFHLDLDQAGEEYASGHCWLPEQIQPVIAEIRAGSVADGSGEKTPALSEAGDRVWRADPRDGLRPFKRIRLNDLWQEE